MSQWRRCTIRLLLAIVLVCCVLLFSLIEAEASGVDDGWGRHRQDFRDEAPPRRYSDPHGQYLGDPSSSPRYINNIPDTVFYDSSVKNELDDYYDDDDDVQVSDAEEDVGPMYEGLLDGDQYEKLYSRPEFSELPHCHKEPEEDGRHSATVVVSTLDGRVTGLDLASGAVRWSHQTGQSTKPLLASSMSKLEVTSGGEWVRLIPSLDGGIFRFDGEGVEALPVTAHNLLHSSFKFNPDTIFTGGKATEVWGMALGTGRVVYVCNTSGCKRNRTADKPAHILVVRRVTQTVRAVDPKSGDERWNFSVGQHEVNLAGSEGCGAGHESWGDEVPDTSDLPSLRFIVPDGVVMGVDTRAHMIWKQKLSSPVVGVWRVERGVVSEVDLFSTTSIPALGPNLDLPPNSQGKSDEQPALYVGVHQKQLYIQQSGHMRHRVTHATRIFTAEAATLDPDSEVSEGVRFPRVEWRPYLATAPSRTPILHHTPPRLHHPLLEYTPVEEQETALTVMHQADYPFDNGYYLYADPGSGLNLSRPWERPEGAEGEDPDSIIDDMASQFLHICFTLGPDTWMHLGIGLLCYLALHYLVLRYIVLQFRRRLTQQALLLARNTIIMLLQNPHILRLIQNMGIQLPALLPPPPQPPAPSPQLKSSPSTSSLPPPSEKSDSSSPEYTSRYLTDFELVRCLGRGGFGTVFQVRNKLDQNEYAVKRIVLPSKESSAERVKREVRALAKLNHSNIVRYYNSWLESPPPGWQDQVDALWKSGDALSTSLLSPSDDTNPGEVVASSKQSTPAKRAAMDNSLSRDVDKLGAGAAWGGVGGMKNPFVSFAADVTQSGEDSFSAFKDNGEVSEAPGNLSEDMSYDIVFRSPLSSSRKSIQSFRGDSSIDTVFEKSQGLAKGSKQSLDSGRGDEESFDIVFEDSQNSSNLPKCSLDAKEDSFDIVFEDNGDTGTAKLSGRNENEKRPKRLWETDWSDTGEQSDNLGYTDNDKTGDSVSKGDNSDSDTNVENSDSDNDHNEDGDSDSIVFEHSKHIDISNPDSSRNNTSHVTSRSYSHECAGNHLTIPKRRRTRSHPARRNQSSGERPSSLSLASTHNTPEPTREIMSPDNENKNLVNEKQPLEGDDKPFKDVDKPPKEDHAPLPKALNPRTYLYIQMELCQKESLRDWLMRNQTRERQVVLGIFNNIVKAVEYVHDNHLMHRDLKPSNIFFSLDGEVKIGDFGLVTTIAEEEGEVRTPAVPLPPPSATSAHHRKHTHRVGTQLYMSPEQVSGATYDYKVDIFSLGLVLLEMLLPFSTGMERLEVMSRARHSQFPPDFLQTHPDETSLLMLMLSQDSSCRPTTRGVRARPPLRHLQLPDALSLIHPSHHFHLPKHRPNSSTSTSTSVSST